MDKLKLAHEMAIAILSMNNACHTMDDAVNIGWQYADLMYAEQEKRTDKTRPAVLGEFQVDWNFAPKWANWWAVDSNMMANWYDEKPVIISRGNQWSCACEYIEDKIIHANIDWRNSLQERK